MTIHYYRRRSNGLIEHTSRTDCVAEEITVERSATETLMGWPTPAMAPELDDDGEPSGWYVGTTADGRVVEVDETITVLGLGQRFDLPDDAEVDEDMEWYGTVTVRIGTVLYDVGAVIGVRESDRGSCRASGAGVRPFLTAWYNDRSDWESARAGMGSEGDGVPDYLADDVIGAIASEARRLWQQR